MFKAQPSCMETGTYIFAVINLIVAVLGSLASIGGLLYMVVFVTTGVIDSKYSDHEMTENTGWIVYGYILWSLLIFVVMMISAVSLVFAGFLMNGANKRKPEHIKAYFVFGVVVSVLVLLAIICYLSFSRDPALILSGLFMWFVYLLILIMIHKTYKQMEVEVAQFSHTPLKNVI